ncbi:GNAT family N-acetyltransferase [Kribbella sp. NPDC026611]|uniref:GNAT family N-acetyltransferase n=1 Tax=Kribbella sp. NPDC026611 TaxID=3154911 RepID=UPI0033FA6A4D
MDELVLRPVEAGDVGAVQELIEADPGYAERVTGYPPGAADAQSLLMMRPEGLPEQAKVVLGAFTAGRLLAVVDLLRGYPDERTAFIGLLQVRWNHQGLGHGRATYRLVEQHVAAWPEIEKLRLAVVDTNAHIATKFWLRQGFAATGEERAYRYDKLETTARLYEKPLREQGRS